MPIKFKVISVSEFQREHSDAAEALEEEDVPTTLPRTHGLVKIPGSSWHPCVLNEDGEPSFFYNDDEGWLACPRNQDFKKV